METTPPAKPLASPLATPSVTIRPARAADVPTLLRLIRELAAFEQAEDKVVATEASLLAEGFGPRPAFEALLAEVESRAVGFALFFHNFSTWQGRRGLYIEDLYVSPSARGLKVGERLVRACAALAVQRGCPRLDLQVLDWNPARGFYQRLGLEHQVAWLPYRASGPALAALAEPLP